VLLSRLEFFLNDTVERFIRKGEELVIPYVCSVCHESTTLSPVDQIGAAIKQRKHRTSKAVVDVFSTKRVCARCLPQDVYASNLNELANRGVYEPLMPISRRPFGVEMEFNGALTTVEESLLGVGLPAFQSYTGSHTSWIVKEDGSVHDGGEINSPPLLGTDGLHMLCRACEAVQPVTEYHPNTGLHIHISANGLSPVAVARLVLLYQKVKPIIDSFMPEHRRNNQYCQGLTADETYSVQRLIEDKDRNPVSYRTVLGAIYGRYKALNVHAHSAHNTVEFRQHNGTCNHRHIAAWIDFAQALVWMAKTDQQIEWPRLVRRYTNDTLRQRLEHLIAIMRLSPWTAAILRGRQRQFTFGQSLLSEPSNPFFPESKWGEFVMRNEFHDGIYERDDYDALYDSDEDEDDSVDVEVIDWDGDQVQEGGLA
jgi:hypothetical protein